MRKMRKKKKKKSEEKRSRRNLQTRGRESESMGIEGGVVSISP